MNVIRRLVLDILKPHEPSITDFAEETNQIQGVEGVNATLVEIDEEVQNIKLTIEGEEIVESEIREKIENLGGSIHSIDQIVCGDKMVEEIHTHHKTNVRKTQRELAKR